MMIDAYGRKINYLRLSVTDRCNLRCRYCMPAEGIPLLPHGEILSYEELFLVARTAVSLGIEKIRVTGGEPLIRKGILGFLSRLAEIPGLRQLVLTTNGLLLEEMAKPLRSAGVQRINISIDSLDPGNFERITRRGDMDRVLAGIRAAESAGFPVKLNMVVMRGVNDHEVVDFAALTLDRPYAVRFIEFMPSGAGEEDWRSLVVPGSEILDRIANRFPFDEVDRGELAGPAKDYRIRGAAGTIGVITPVSGHFCRDCNRIRVTASGKARGCLFSRRETDLAPLLREAGAPGLTSALLDIVRKKPDRHRLAGDEPGNGPLGMSRIGG
ncbi:MAG: GTP 3',8-cyclase MoaA [Deltaproteobacteria bacterium]|nr:GTP 3',8-cyclase MoaA [Deltaproteobacteria bacterium]